jgi:alkanesulfonate monooxygenase
MSLRFGWYAPTHGDGRIIGGRSPDLGWSPAYIDEVALAAERAGFDTILIPAGPGCADGFVTAAHVARATRTIRCLVACRTGSASPSFVAKAAATLDHVLGGRLELNIVTGGSPQELRMEGDHVEHDRRYERTREFMGLLRALWTSDGVTHCGEFFHIVEAAFEPKPVQPDGPPLFLGGSSDGAVQAAAEAADVYLMWGEPSPAVENQIAKVREAAAALGREPRFGMRINLIVDAESDAAWERARAMLADVDPAMAARAEAYLATSDSTAVSRIQALQHVQAEDSAFWTGMVPLRSGNSTALVGSVAHVVSSLQRYVDAGVSEFLFSAYPHHETVMQIGTSVIPGVRAYVGDES